jgi:hypothetical protein
MGLAAIIGMAVSIFGVGLVFITFRETRRSANEAQRQADYFINNERPHLRVHPLSLASAGLETTIRARVENYGASPAILTDFVWFLSASDWFPGAREIERHPLKRFSSSPKVEAGKNSEIGPIKGSLTAGFLGGRVRFLSRFNPEHEAYFLWEITQFENGELGVIPRRPDQDRGWPKEI